MNRTGGETEKGVTQDGTVGKGGEFAPIYQTRFVPGRQDGGNIRDAYIGAMRSLPTSVVSSTC